MLSPHENKILCQTGAGTPMGELFRRFWLPVMLTEELPGPDCAPVATRILGEDLVAFRDTNGQVGLIQAYCAHRHAHLFWGRNEEGGLRCTYHGWKFDLNGDCVDMPNEPAENNFKDKTKITAYPTREMGKMIWAYMGPPELMPPELPQFEGAGLADSHWHVNKEIQLSNWAQAVEGGIDSSHISYLHRSLESLNAARAGVPEFEPPVMVDGRLHQILAAVDRSPTFFVEDADFGLWIGARRDAGPENYYWRLTPFFVPFYTLIPGGGSGKGGHAWVPIDDEHCWAYSFGWNTEHEDTGRGGLATDVEKSRPMWELGLSNSYYPEVNRFNNYQISREAQRRESFTGIKGIREQDRSIQESMGVMVPREQEHLGTTDRGIIEFRRLMLQLARELSEGKEPEQPHRPDVYSAISTAVVLDREVAWREGTKEYVKARN